MTTLPRGEAFTRHDLESMPDDGRRYELVDGSLVVTPAPSRRHQHVLMRLTVLLAPLCPPELELLFAPFDVALAEDTVLQPDLLIARTSDLTERDLPRAPVLAVEILSPTTQSIDLTVKKARFQAASCPSYWVIDVEEPSLTVWELEGGQYVERGHAVGDEDLVVLSPFEVTITPGELLA